MRLPESTLRAYRRFSLYNSPYPAHAAGCAVDLYPARNEALSPVAGTVRETRTVRAPPKPYAADDEHLVLVDVDAAESGLDAAGTSDGLVARILHVRPEVSAGDVVAVGDSLGPMIRSGFFAPWVANHLHLGFRDATQNLHRAGGSHPVDVGVDVEPMRWDGTGTVVESGETYALLDTPERSASDDRFVGIAGVVAPSDRSDAAEDAQETVVLDGGLTHYGGGGALGRHHEVPGPVSFLGHRVGDTSGRTVAWRDVDVLANGDRITGLSLFTGCDPEFGAKLVCPERTFAVGEQVRVTIRDSDDPIRLG
ncbi:hypothetical protein DVK02_14200 [Halobellus sp. Atlit-31R]|nr:hypothetical protein DVK02_14200 [Halobellus sp. Atlit-31R]